MFIAFGAAFEVPVVVVVLARMGIVSIEQLKGFRGYFIVLAFIVAAVMTPPDIVSQLALAIPMCLLYEVGIWAAQIFIRHTQAPAEADEDQRRTRELAFGAAAAGAGGRWADGHVEVELCARRAGRRSPRRSAA